jgi:hypothetical protein
MALHLGGWAIRPRVLIRFELISADDTSYDGGLTSVIFPTSHAPSRALPRWRCLRSSRSSLRRKQLSGAETDGTRDQGIGRLCPRTERRREPNPQWRKVASSPCDWVHDDKVSVLPEEMSLSPRFTVPAQPHKRIRRTFAQIAADETAKIPRPAVRRRAAWI